MKTGQPRACHPKVVYVKLQHAELQLVKHNPSVVVSEAIQQHHLWTEPGPAAPCHPETHHITIAAKHSTGRATLCPLNKSEEDHQDV
ncbi:hypothetical protein F7725_026545 [Dissostichus mawsoni]|uniref:Uncharacterized protein n=1 Tax=Dissostichus mawsoni TaxID=36200 RepID=A0A7J5X7A4_DISMA|nr:hypothetical protein F7725_026545 [Dissostichus mawsoni]